MFLEGTLRAFDLSLARICGVCLQVCFGATASSSSFLILFVLAVIVIVLVVVDLGFAGVFPLAVGRGRQIHTHHIPQRELF